MTHSQTITICGEQLRIVPHTDNEEGLVETVVYDDGPFGIPLKYRIWEVSARPDCDRFRYESPKGSTYSHPTHSGARHMIATDLVDLNIILVPEDNSHLSAQNMTRLRSIIHARQKIISEKPLVGDIIEIDGAYHRICNSVEFGAQTTRGGSFHISRNGASSFSGGLDRARAYEWIKPTKNNATADFWMWDAVKGMGGGNGVNISMEVPVWSLLDFEMSREVAEAHPRTLRAKQFYEGYDSYTREVERVITDLMDGYT